MAKQKPTNGEPRLPEKKFGPFAGGVTVCVWRNEVKTDEGIRFFRSVTLQPRRYRDPRTGKWKDAKSLRPVDLPAVILAMEAAHHFCSSTPLPGEAVNADDVDALAEGEVPAELAAS